MRVLLLISFVLFAQRAAACPRCNERGADQGGYPSFVPMGPDGKARYYGSRHDKNELTLTEDKNAKVEEAQSEKTTKKAEGNSAPPTKKKAKIKD